MKMKNKLFLGLTILGIATAGAALSIGETGAVKTDAAEAVSYTYDFVTNFETYAGSWGTSYAEHIVSSTALGDDLPAAEVKFGSANKQSSGNSIDDRPVSKGSNNVFTLQEPGYYITSFTLQTEQWGTKDASFSVSYKSGEQDVALSGTSNCFSGYTWEIPAADHATVINFNQTNTKNQVGYSSITVEIEKEAQVDAIDHISITSLPNKTLYDVGDVFDSTGITVLGYDSADESTANAITMTDLSYNVGEEPFSSDDVGTKEVTVTATHNGQKYTDTFEITVLPAPVVTNDFGTFGFPATDGETTGDVAPIYSRAIMIGGNRFTLHMEADKDTVYRVQPANDHDSGIQQIGTNGTTIDNWYIKSGVLGSEDGRVSVKRVSLTLKGTSSKSAFDVSATLGGAEMTVEGESHFEGTPEKTIVFTPADNASGVGSLKINFSNIVSGVGLAEIKVYLENEADADVAAAYFFAHKLELVDSCNSEEYAAILDAYGKLSPDQKEIANEILLDDYIDDMNTRETIGIGSTTVLEKITAIDSRQTTSANGSFIPNESTADNTLYIALGTALGTAALAIAAAVIIKKRHAVSE